MSGGSFDYLHAKFRDGDDRRWQLDGMIAWLEDRADVDGLPEAYREALGLLQALRLDIRQVDLEGERLASLLRSIEWVASCDYGPEDIAEEVAKLRKKP